MKILTPSGFKDIKELKVGDTIYGADGGLQRVTGITPQKDVPMYEVRTADDCSVLVPEGQVLNVRVVDGNGFLAGFRNFSIETMIEKGITRRPPSSLIRRKSPVPRFEIPTAGHIDFETKSFDVHPYILGVLIGDGYLGGRNYIYFSTPDMDAEIADKIASLLPENYYLKKDTCPACPRYLIVLKDKMDRGNGYIHKIERLGINKLSRDKFIPPEYLLGDREQRLELLRGLMDTDGCAQSNRISFNTSSPQLVSDIIELVRSLGGICRYSKYDRGEKGIDYDVRFRLWDCPFSLKRKSAEWRPPIMKRHLISSIQRTNIVEDIVRIKASNPNGLFITNNYLIIHT